MTLRSLIEGWLRESPNWLEQPFAPPYRRWRDVGQEKFDEMDRVELSTDLAAVRELLREAQRERS